MTKYVYDILKLNQFEYCLPRPVVEALKVIATNGEVSDLDPVSFHKLMGELLLNDGLLFIINFWKENGGWSYSFDLVSSDLSDLKTLALEREEHFSSGEIYDSIFINKLGMVYDLKYSKKISIGDDCRLEDLYLK